jgi:methylated-DNA-[protein]-cysteine S-methyltransferase
MVCSPPLRLVLAWSGGMLDFITLQKARSGEPSPAEELSSAARALQNELDRYVRGLEPAWPELPLSWSSCTPFVRLVLRTLSERVPYGEWVSYSGLAELCGRPQAARAVGGAMSRNPWPLLVPCHRVLAKARGLGGFGAGLDLKEYLLALEGISGVGDGRYIGGR